MNSVIVWPIPGAAADGTAFVMACAEAVWHAENSDVSPVPRFLAVPVTTAPSGASVGNVDENVASPASVVATVTEPR